MARKFKRGAKGTDLGGQFIGARSVAHFLAKMLTPAASAKQDRDLKTRVPGPPSKALGRVMAARAVPSGGDRALRRDAADVAHLRAQADVLDARRTGPKRPGDPLLDAGNRRANMDAAARTRAQADQVQARVDAHEGIKADNEATYGDAPLPQTTVAQARAAVERLQAKASGGRAARKMAAARRAPVPEAPKANPLAVANPDGLDAMPDHSLRSLAVEYDLGPRSGESRDSLLGKLRGAGAVSPDVARQRAEAETPSAPEGLSSDPAVRAAQIENRVRAAYEAAIQGRAAGRSRYVNLADIRERVGDDVPRAELDRQLLLMNRQYGVAVEPESNQKSLTAAQHDAAVIIGDQRKHLITIEDPSPRPLPEPSAPGPGTQADTGGQRQLRPLFARGEVIPAFDPASVPAPSGPPSAAGAEADAAIAKLESILRGVPSANKPSSRTGGMTEREFVQDIQAKLRSGELSPMLAGERLRGLATYNAAGDRLDKSALFADAAQHLPEFGQPGKKTAAAKMARAKAPKVAASPADAATSVRRMSSEEDILAALKDVRAADVPRLADELNVRIPSATRSAGARKLYIAQTVAEHNRRTGGVSHIGPRDATASARATAAEQRAAIKAHRAANERGRAAANETMLSGDLGSIDAVARAVTAGSARKTAAQKMTAAKASSAWSPANMTTVGADPLDVAERIAGAPGESAILGHMAGMTVADLRKVARELNMPLPKASGGRWTADALRQYISTTHLRDRPRWSLR